VASTASSPPPVPKKIKKQIVITDITPSGEPLDREARKLALQVQQMERGDVSKPKKRKRAFGDPAIAAGGADSTEQKLKKVKKRSPSPEVKPKKKKKLASPLPSESVGSGMGSHVVAVRALTVNVKPESDITSSGQKSPGHVRPDSDSSSTMRASPAPGLKSPGTSLPSPISIKPVSPALPVVSPPAEPEPLPEPIMWTISKQATTADRIAFLQDRVLNSKHFAHVAKDLALHGVCKS